MKFDDAKVLRSNETTLVLQEIRILYANLESGDNDIQDLKKLTTIGTKLEECMGEYYEKIDGATTQARINVRSGADPNTTEQVLNLVIAQLDAMYGEGLADDVILTMSEWQWMRDRWKRNNKLIGQKEIRLKILRIDEALENAKGVQFVNKAAWVQGEPEPQSQIAEVFKSA